MILSALHLAIMVLLFKHVRGDSGLFSAVGDDTLDQDLFYPNPGLFADLGDSSDVNVVPLLVSDTQEILSLFSEEPQQAQGFELSDDDDLISPVAGADAEILSSCSDNTNKPIGKLRNRDSTCSNLDGPSTPLGLPDLSNLLNKIDGGSNDNLLFDAWRQTSAEQEKLMQQLKAFCTKASPLFSVPVCGLQNPYRQLEAPSPPGTFWSDLNDFPLYRVDNARLCKLNLFR